MLQSRGADYLPTSRPVSDFLARLCSLFAGQATAQTNGGLRPLPLSRPPSLCSYALCVGRFRGRYVTWNFVAVRWNGRFRLFAVPP